MFPLCFYFLNIQRSYTFPPPHFSFHNPQSFSFFPVNQNQFKGERFHHLICIAFCQLDLSLKLQTECQTGPLDFEDTRNQGNRRRGGASAPPRTRLGVLPSKFCSARYRHFENLVSRKIQSLRNPESIKYSVLFIVRLSLSTIPCLPVCLNAKYQSTPPPPHPSHSIAACLSLSSVRACAYKVQNIGTGR